MLTHTRTRTRRHLARRHLAALAVISLALGGVAACGGDDDDSEALSLDDFVSQADAICAEMETELDAAGEEAFGSATELPSEEELTAFVDDEVIPRVQSQIDAISALEPPAEIADDVDDLIETAESELEALKDNDDLTTLFSNNEDPFTESNAKSGELGLTDCDGSDDTA